MKARLIRYVHESNGLSVEVIPETEDEQTFLDAIWEFGHLDSGYSSDNPRARSYSVRAYCRGKPGMPKSEEANAQQA